MENMTTLEKLFYSEAAGHSDERRPEEAATYFYLDKINEELDKYIPAGDIDELNYFSDMIGMLSRACEKHAFNRALKFALSFMCETMAPVIPTKDELVAEYENLTKRKHKYPIIADTRT